MNSHDFSNKTEFGIQKEAERYTWVGYMLFVLISSLIGDTTILVASIRYKAFKLHSCIVAIIQHIAVCDLMVSLSGALPRVVALIADNWVLGDWFCDIQPYVKYYLNVVGMYLICSMTTCKLVILRAPLRAMGLESRKAHLGCAVIWISVLSLPAAFFLVDKSDQIYDFRAYNCEFGYSSVIWKWLRPLLSTVFMVIPNFLVIASTVNLLIIAKKVASQGRHTVKWQGIITIILVAVIYCLSLLPYAIYSFVGPRLADKNSFFHNEYLRISLSCLYFNTMSNFYIYSLTVASFRQFLLSRILGSKQLMSSNAIASSQGK